MRGEDEAVVDAAVAARLGAMDRPPPWIDVTIALRFMAEDSRIVLHKVQSHAFARFKRGTTDFPACFFNYLSGSFIGPLATIFSSPSICFLHATTDWSIQRRVCLQCRFSENEADMHFRFIRYVLCEEVQEGQR